MNKCANCNKEFTMNSFPVTSFNVGEGGAYRWYCKDCSNSGIAGFNLTGMDINMGGSDVADVKRRESDHEILFKEVRSNTKDIIKLKKEIKEISASRKKKSMEQAKKDIHRFDDLIKTNRVDSRVDTRVDTTTATLSDNDDYATQLLFYNNLFSGIIEQLIELRQWIGDTNNWNDHIDYMIEVLQSSRMEDNNTINID